MVLLPAAGGPVSRSGRTSSLWHPLARRPVRQSGCMSPGGADRPTAPGGRGSARRPLPTAGYLRRPRREHHLPARQHRRPHLVRVHRPRRHGRGVDSAAAIRSEIAWLQAIRAETERPSEHAVGGRRVHHRPRSSAAGETTGLLGAALDGRTHPRSSPRPVHPPLRRGRDVDSARPPPRSPARGHPRPTRDLAVPSLSALRRMHGRRGARGRGDPVCSVLRWMDGRIHESSPRPVRGSRGDPPARPGRCVDARPTSSASTGTTRRSSATSWSTGHPRPASAGPLLPPVVRPVSEPGGRLGRTGIRRLQVGGVGLSTPICTSATRSSRNGGV